MPGPIIAISRLLHSGTVLFVNPDNNGNSGGLNFTGAGGSIKVNGVSRPLVDPVWSGSLKGFWYALPTAPRTRAIIDDSNEGAYWTKTGTWTRLVAGTDGPFGRFGNDGNTCSRGNNFSISSDPSGSCTWHFAGLIPRPYRVYVDIWDLVGPDRTTGGLYTVKDGSGTVLATRPWDLTATLYPGFDWTFDGTAWHLVAEVVLPSGQDTITLTLSNPAGSGKLVADAAFLMSLNAPVAVAGDTVSVSYAPGAFSVGGVDNEAVVDFPTTVESDDSFWPAAPDPADRTTVVGFNIEGMRCDYLQRNLADRSMGDDVWSGPTVVLDSHHEMIAHTTGDMIRQLIVPPNLEYDERGVEVLRDGPVWAEFNVSGVAFDGAAQAATGFTSTGYGLGPKIWEDRGGGRWRLTQSVISPTWQPISARSASYTPRWSYQLGFKSTVNNLLITQFKWYDSLTPPDWDKTIHPSDHARLNGVAAVLRSMKPFEVESGQMVEIGDWISPLDLASPQAGGAGYRLKTATVSYIRPAVFTDDSDHFGRYFNPVGNIDSAWFVATVDDATVFAPGAMVHWAGPDLPGNIPGADGGGNWPIRPTVIVYQVYAIDSTHLLIHTINGDFTTYDSSGGVRAMIAAPQSISLQLSTNKSNRMSIPAFMAMCNDINAEAWINLPSRISDTGIAGVADLVLANLPPGRKLWLELCNEIWNPAYKHNYVYFEAQAIHTEYLAPGTLIPGGGTAEWVSHRAIQCFDIFRARFAADGRDPDDVIRVIGSQTANQAYTYAAARQFHHENKVFDSVCFEAYEDLKPIGGNFSTWGDMGTILQRLEPDGYLDVLGISLFQGSRDSDMAGHRNVLNDPTYGGRFAAVEFSAYEGGFAYIVSPTSATTGYETPNVGKWMQHEMLHSPRMHRMVLGHLAFMQAVEITCDIRYSYCYGYMVGTMEAWTELYGAFSMIGTGDPAENANPYDAPTLLTQTMSGRKEWMAPSAPAPPSYSISGMVTVPYQAGWETPEWSWSFWARIPTSSTSPGFLSTELTGGGATTGVCTEVYSGDLYVTVHGTQSKFSDPENAWHHFVFTYDYDEFNIFKDGVEVHSHFPGDMVWSGNSLKFAGGGHVSCRFKDLRIYNRRLPIEDVATLFTGAEVDAGMTYNWRLNEGSGDVVTDSVAGAVGTGSGISWNEDVPSQNPGAPLEPEPTTLVVSGPGTITQGVPATFTATLDIAALAGGLSFFPASFGFTATFSPNPVVFAEGNTSKTFSANATSAGSGTVGGIVPGLYVEFKSVTVTPTPTPPTPYSPAVLYGATDFMVLEDYNGPTMPVNLDGDPYPYQYSGEGTATVALDSGVKINGNSTRFNVTAGGFYPQWNPYEGSDRSFARDYSANPAGWLFDTYDRLTFWIKRPLGSSPLFTDGNSFAGPQFGVYNKQITSEQHDSDEFGGSHYYNLLNMPNNGCWTQVVLNMHPNHRRGDAGGTEPGMVPYPTATDGPNGGADPPSTYNYWDTLTRFYIEEVTETLGSYHLDEIVFYRQPHPENDVQVNSLTGTYNPATNEIAVTWSRPVTEDSVNHDVRYAFSNFHTLGWTGAGTFAAATISPPGSGGYNGMFYVSTALPLTGHDVVYIAIRPVGATLFSQIAIPLTDFTTTPTPTPTPTPTGTMGYPYEVRDSTNGTTDNLKSGLTPTVADGKTLASPPVAVTASGKVAVVEIGHGVYLVTYDAETHGDAAFPVDWGATLADPNDRHGNLILTRDRGRLLAMYDTMALYGGLQLTGRVAASPAPSSTGFAVTLDRALPVGKTASGIEGQYCFLRAGGAQTEANPIKTCVIGSSTSLTLTFTAPAVFSTAPSPGDPITISE